MEGGSVEEVPDSASLITDHLSDEDVSDSQTLPDLTHQQIVRWFERGQARFRKHTQMDDIIRRVLFTEAQVQNIPGADQARRETIRSYRAQDICIDTDDEDEDHEPYAFEGGMKTNAPMGHAVICQ